MTAIEGAGGDRDTACAPAPLVYRLRTGGRIQYAVALDGELRVLEGELFGRWRPGALLAGGLEAAHVLPPVVPSKIVAIGLNYRDHAAEQQKQLPAEPLMFLKPSTAVIGPGEAIRLPPGVGRVDYEAELAVVIGRRATRVRAADALEYVLGATCLNDVTARDLQRREQQYTRPKGFDTFAPVGPAVALGLDLRDRPVECWVNGVRRQRSSTANLIFGVPELVEFISAVMTLLPGDIIATGTPAGIGPLAPGDTATVRIGGIGELTNPVAAG
jgi:2-keto-4-pentenoate hydratase/2-oxohepta-3-ene-1,7-dioic acid hydratase in catechol pathway